MSAEGLPIPEEEIDTRIESFLAPKLGELITGDSIEDL